MTKLENWAQTQKGEKMTKLENLVLEGLTSQMLVRMGFKAPMIKNARKRLLKTGDFKLDANNRIVQK